MLASPTTDTEYLQSLRSVRERCFKVQEAAARQRLQHFDVDPSKLDDMVHIVVSLIKRDFDHPTDMPVHGRWRHFDVGGRPRIQNLIQSWASLGEQPLEQTRRVLDLFVVAVLLDIETGHNWAYREQLTGRMLKRNEGVAVAVLEMFMAGTFSSDSNKPHRVDCKYTIIYQSTSFFFVKAFYLYVSWGSLCIVNGNTGQGSPSRAASYVHLGRSQWSSRLAASLGPYRLYAQWLLWWCWNRCCPTRQPHG